MLVDSEGFLDPKSLLGEFKTDLWFPHYRVATSGRWQIVFAQMVVSRGYWGASHRVGGMVVLKGPGIDGVASWMSTTPWEIESQAIGLAAARGHTVVLGLGMGWQMANAALNCEVERVTVVERDPNILAMARAQKLLEQLPTDARQKIEIVQADATTWRPQAPVDTLLADIWERTDGPNRMGEIRRVHANIGPCAIHVWGQEVLIWRAAQHRGAPSPALDWPLIRAIVDDEFGLPLILPDWPDYPQKIASAARWWTW